MVPRQSQVVQQLDQIGITTDNFDLSTITTADVIFAISSLVAAFILSRLAKRSLNRVFNRLEDMPPLAGDMIARITGYLIVAIGFVLALEALGFSLGPLGGLLLLVIVMVVIAAQPLLRDLGAGLIIQIRRPFRAGDQIRLEGHEGVVAEVTARALRLQTVDGRRIHIPNRHVLEKAIDNLTVGGTRMTTFTTGLAYDTDLDRARVVIVEALDGVPGVSSERPPQAFVEEFADSTINVACRFWHDPKIEEEWAARDEAMRAVKRALDANGITIAFPQRVLWTGQAAPVRNT